MDNKGAFLFSLFACIMVLAGCGDRHCKAIDTAYAIVNDSPDSALSILNHLNQHGLSNSEKARYALVYTMAQDKGGLDVNNDSLLRTAYTYYSAKPNDSLYAKCQYYMGKYYMLNDSSEKALDCFQHSVTAARKTMDYLTESMSLLKTSVILSGYDTNKSISFARLAYKSFGFLKNGSLKNEVYLILNLAECLSYKEGKMDSCLLLVKKAIGYAKISKDSTAMADALQDLSNFYDMSGNVTMALRTAEESFCYRNNHDVSAILTFSNALYKAGEISKAKNLLSQIKRQEYHDYGDVIYSLHRLIARKECDLISVCNYADSIESYLYSKNAEDLAAKDKFYKLIVDKEAKKVSAQKESQLMTILIIITLVLSAIIIILVVIKAKKDKRIQEMNIKNKELQLANVRSFLLKKIDIIRKLKNENDKDYIKGSMKSVVLDDNDWEELEVFLDNADNMFVKRIKAQFPILTKKDIRFLMLIRLHLPVHKIAEIYHIKDTSVRQKLFLIKSKIGLKSGDDSAQEFIDNY